MSLMRDTVWKRNQILHNDQIRRKEKYYTVHPVKLFLSSGLT